MSDNPYHNQHILEYTRCMDETAYELQQHYDQILLQLYAEVERISDHVAALEQKASSSPFQLDFQITKEQLHKLRNTIIGAFKR